MSRNQRLLEAAAQLRPLQVRNYAESRRWEPVSGIRGRLWVLRHPEQHLRQVQIPMDAEDPGFAEAMLIMAGRFAELEGRETDEVLSDLQHPDADTLRVRVLTGEARSGQLPLADDINLREGARRALLAAASSVVSPALHHPRLSRSQAEQLVKSCLAGQTEQGSYVVKIVCPLDAVEEPQTLFETTPFVRRTTRLLMEATSELVESIERDQIDEFLERDGRQPKVSWNLCDALLRMRPSEGGKVQLSINWAADPSVPPPVGVPARVSLPAEYFPRVEKVANALRPPAAQSQVQQFIGTVESLDGTVGVDGRRAGDVILRVFTEEGEAVTARASLTADQYAAADQAHMQGHGYVWMRGLLWRGVRMGRIEQIEQFGPASPGAP